MRYLVVGVVALLCVVFVVSATSKVRGRREFEASLRGLRLLPQRWVATVAAVVTVVEAALAVGLAASGVLVARSGGRVVALVALVGAGVLLLVLSAGIGLALGRGVGGSCACFGATERPLGRRHLVRNGVLLAAALLGLVALSDRSHVEVAGALIAVCAGGITAVVLIHLDELVDLFTSSPVAARPASTASTASTRR